MLQKVAARRAEFRLPNNKQRTTIIGRTGSGKTVFGAHLLSISGFDRQPWIVIDYKKDELFAGVDRIEEIGFKNIPKKPGLYTVYPVPETDDEALTSLLWEIWQKENVGVFIDEYYSIPNSGAIRALLTQGRSKRIPIIGLTQRPSWISRFAMSEADFFAVFHLNDKDDRLTVRRLANTDPDLRLNDHWSQWYDVGQDAHFIMKPAPKPEDIQEKFNDRLTPKKRFW